jgi:transposase
MKVDTIYGLDLAKATVHIFGMEGDKVVKDVSLPRKRVIEYFSKQVGVRIFMEACGGANWWSQRLSKMGHEVRLISPQFVKPFVGRQKNDRNDARAILEAGIRPTIRKQKGKKPEVQDLQMLLNIRAQLIQERVAVSNQIKSILLEYGVVLSRGKKLYEVLEDGYNDLTLMVREILSEREESRKRLLEKEKTYTLKIEVLLKDNARAQKLLEIKGVGAIITAAFMVAVPEPQEFKNGRQVAAYIGLVPRQISSGKTTKTVGITKTGNTYLRQALVHGARSFAWKCEREKSKPITDEDVVWMNKLLERKHVNIACVALANKLARRMWAISMTS